MSCCNCGLGDHETPSCDKATSQDQKFDILLDAEFKRYAKEKEIPDSGSIGAPSDWAYWSAFHFAHWQREQDQNEIKDLKQRNEILIRVNADLRSIGEAFDIVCKNNLKLNREIEDLKGKKP